MTTAKTLRKGWCPGALRPMQTGDGLLVRVRPRAGSYSLPALRAIAETAARFGSGEIDLTNRANLQLRGLSEDTYGEAIATLQAAGLIDDDANTEAVRNVVVDPLSGLDPARVDMRPLATEFEKRLVEKPELHALPGKFGFALNGSRASKLKADIVLTALDAQTCLLHLDGKAGSTAAVVRHADAAGAMARLAGTFLAIIREYPEVRRMRHALTFATVQEFFMMSRLQVAEHFAASPEQDAAPVGVLCHNAAPFAVGIGLPFGRVGAVQLSRLCDGAATAGCGEVRPSTERALVLPVRRVNDARDLLSLATSLGLITNPADARLAIDVCPGAPACRNATTPTRADAERLIAGLAAYGRSVPSIHISGCAKGCACRDAATLTFIGRDGGYDLVRDGTADGSPTLTGIAPRDLAVAAIQTLTDRAS